MNIGKFRNRITFQSETEISDGYGGSVTTWSDYKAVWANISTLNGKERIQGQQIETEYTHKIYTRFLNVNDKMRVLYKDRVFEIVSAINIEERNKYLEIMCIETS